MQSLKFLNGTLNTKNQWLNLPTRNISIYNREFVNRVSFGVIVRCPFVISNYNLKKVRKWLRSRQWILCNFSIFAGIFCRYYPQTDIKHQANDFILFLLRFTINFLHDLILFRNFFLFFCPAFADKLTDIHQRKKNGCGRSARVNSVYDCIFPANFCLFAYNPLRRLHKM